MYSVVLMVAMTGGADASAWFGRSDCHSSHYSSCYGSCHGYYETSHSWSCHGSSCHGWSRHGHSCHGCYGSSCNGGWSSCSGYSCHGWGHREHHSCHGCYGSCSGYAYVDYGCCGGHSHGHRHWGHRHCCGGEGCYGSYACNGGYGCTGNYGGCTGAPVVPQGKPVEKIEAKPVEKSTELQSAAPATLIVSLPANAKLLIDDAATASTSARRVFVSPTLPVGQDFTYSLKAEFTKNGKPVVVSKEVTVRAGAEINVTIEEGLASVASR
jgi:uncharacterized protein (TIGR03000 family)